MARLKPFGWTTAREIAIVVLSILIAFSLDAWWDGVRARADRAARLSSVLDELGAAGAVLAQARQAHLTVVDHVEGVRARLAADVGAGSVAIPDSLLGPLLIPMVFEIPTHVTESFLASDAAQEVGSAELESALRAWPTAVEDLRDDQLHLRDFLSRELGPFLRSTSPIHVAQDRAIIWMRSLGPGAPPPEATAIDIGLVRSQELENLLSWRQVLEEAIVRDFSALEETRRHVVTLVEGAS